MTAAAPELWNHVIIRDGRINRDPSKVTDEGGEVLAEFDTDDTLEVGQRLFLPDGSQVEVIGGKKTMHFAEDAVVGAGGLPVSHVTQVVFVGGVWFEG